MILPINNWGIPNEVAWMMAPIMIIPVPIATLSRRPSLCPNATMIKAPNMANSSNIASISPRLYITYQTSAPAMWRPDGKCLQNLPNSIPRLHSAPNQWRDSPKTPRSYPNRIHPIPVISTIPDLPPTRSDGDPNRRVSSS